jgi:Polysaccharide deacetylase
VVGELQGRSRRAVRRAVARGSASVTENSSAVSIRSKCGKGWHAKCVEAVCENLGVGLVVFWMEPLGVLGVLERLTPNFIYRIRTERPLVALSFDDGPHPEFTPQVLEILERHDARATFFLVGGRALHILHHDGISDPRRSIQALPHILTTGREMGLRFVSIGQLLRDGQEPMDTN